VSPGRFLIDVTDARFHIAPNDDVLAFVRRANPFAHSDVGGVLFALGREIDGAHAYCPSTASFAYVVLHTASHRIFAIAYGMRGLAFRLAPPSYAAALADGGTPRPEIGPDWLAFEPYAPTPAIASGRLLRWATQACLDATAAGRSAG
jgi:hypothetical protein